MKATRRSGAGPAEDTVSRRIGRVTLGVLITVLVVGGASAWALLRSASEIDRLATGYAPAGDANNAALTYMLDAETGIRGYALTGTAASLHPYRIAVREILPTIDAVSASLHDVDDHSLDAAVATERRLAQRWITTIAVPAERGPAAARRQTQTATGRVRFDAFRRANGAVASELERTRRGLSSDTADLSDWLFPLVLAAVVLALLGSGFAALRTARSVSGPLRALSEVVRRLEGGDLEVRADEAAGPVEVRTVSSAVNLLANERARALVQDQVDDRLRAEVRDLTSAIRIGQDAQVIARTLVAGLGQVFDVDLVWLVTFEDNRVPRIAQRWRRAHDDDDPIDAVEDDLMLRALANRLWHGETVVAVADHRAPAGAAFTVPPLAADSRASVVAAIGEGNSAIGVLWLATTAGPRGWSAAELGLVQHVAGELAQNLVQNHVLTQQRAAMRRLREADEAKTALVSTVSHELRTPLTSIIGYLAVLLETHGPELDEDVVSMLNVVERNAIRLREMIDDLLKQSELEAGRRAGVLDRADLADVLDDVRETIAPLATNSRLELETRRPEPGMVIVDGDGRELSQAVINLAANAVKFTRAGGRVTISAGRDGAQAEVRVTDTGIGIPADEIPHLFERFFRARNARSAVIPGTGLGLAIVADIVERHGGTIEVSSTLGVGTSFVIHLPLTTH